MSDKFSYSKEIYLCHTPKICINLHFLFESEVATQKFFQQNEYWENIFCLVYIYVSELYRDIGSDIEEV